MKKIFSLVAALIFVVGCISMPVSAALSPEVDGIISKISVKDNKSQSVSVELKKPAKTIDALKPSSKDDALISQYELTVEGNPEFPLTFTANIAGVKTTSKVYILAQEEDGSVQYIEAKVISDGVIEFKLDKRYKFIAVLGDKVTATRIGVSDKTGDTLTTVAALALVASMAVAALSLKKIKE